MSDRIMSDAVIIDDLIEAIEFKITWIEFWRELLPRYAKQLQEAIASGEQRQITRLTYITTRIEEMVAEHVREGEALLNAFLVMKGTLIAMLHSPVEDVASAFPTVQF